MRMREDAWQSESDRHKRVAYCCGKDECVVEGEERRLREGEGGGQRRLTYTRTTK